MRKIALAIIGVLMLVGAFFGAKVLIDSKKKPRPRARKVVKSVFVEEVRNGRVPIIIEANGRLTATKRIELFSEVQGVLKGTGKPFKPGQSYRQGEVLLRLDASEYYASVQAAKSNLYNLVSSIMPDLRLDYPAVFPKWQQYLASFDMEKATPELPKASTEQEKFFITGRNIYSTYYNVKNLEQRLSKFTIRAPFSGVLTEALVTEGTLVRNGQKLGSFINTGAYELEVAVPSEYGYLLKVNESVTLRNLEGTQTYQGQVVRVNAAVDAVNQTVSAFVQVNDANLKEGMFLNAALSAKNEENAISLSRNLLQQNNEVFYVVNDTILNAISVSPVFFSDKEVVIKGIPDGTKILSKPVAGAYPGMLVTVVEEGPETRSKP